MSITFGANFFLDDFFGTVEEALDRIRPEVPNDMKKSTAADTAR
jgi:hypothetical protein